MSSQATLERAPAAPRTTAAPAARPLRRPLAPLTSFIPRQRSAKVVELELMPLRAAVAWLLGACGLALIAAAYALTRSGSGGGQLPFFVGLALVVGPAAARLVDAHSGRGERVLILGGLAVLLYLVKVAHDPLMFTFADEHFHVRNVQEIVASGTVFRENSLLPVTARYPGLPLAASAFSSMTGASPFASGLVVVGVARLLLTLGLFLLLERAARSAWIASCAALLYAANPSFLFFTSQFSYESLALPLAIVALLCVVERNSRGGSSKAWTLAAIVLASAVVLTHHLTSYLLGGALLLLTLAGLRQEWSRRARWWDIGAFTLAGAVVWLLLAALPAADYLADIFGRASSGVVDILSGVSSGRGLFRSVEGETAPLWERVDALGTTVAIAAVVAIGVLVHRRRLTSTPLLRLLTLMAIGYVLVQPLRLVPSGWEIANRASEFLFIGVALVLALTLAEAVRRSGRRWASTAFALFAALVVTGAVIIGWPPSVRLGQAVEAQVPTGATVVAPGLRVARWAPEALGANRRFLAADSNGRLLLSVGGQRSLEPRRDELDEVLFRGRLTDGQIDTIRRTRLEFVAVDARKRAQDNMSGYFLGPSKRAQASVRAAAKFDRNPQVDRVYDNGTLRVYDVRRLRR